MSSRAYGNEVSDTGAQRIVRMLLGLVDTNILLLEVHIEVRARPDGGLRQLQVSTILGNTK